MMKYFKIVFLALIVMLVALSCVTKSKCLQRYPPSSDTLKTVLIKDSIIIRDTTIFVTIPGETVIDSVIIPCPPPPPSYMPEKVCTETSLAKACAWFEWPIIKLELIQHDTVILSQLKGALKESYHWKEMYLKVTEKPQPEKYIPKIIKIFAWTGGLALVILIGWTILFVKKKFF